MIIATCGHSTDTMNDLINCSLGGYTHEGDRCVEYVCYCKKCYGEAIKDGIVLFDEGEENKWLNYNGTGN